jgi:RNA 3'-terminal phosphate cyclase-like protein
MSSATDPTNSHLSFSGHEHFRHRLVLSILSGRPVRINKIRPADANPGLRGPFIRPIDRERNRAEHLLPCETDYEVSLLRLLERVTNGTVIEISVTGVFARVGSYAVTNGLFVKVPRSCSSLGSSLEVQLPTNVHYLAQLVITWSPSL